MGRTTKKGLLDDDVVLESPETPLNRRSSGRIRGLSKRVRLDTDQREEVKQNARNARLESLENDNYQEEIQPDDEDFIDGDDDDVLFKKRKKKQRKTAKELFIKKKKFLVRNFNTALEESVLETYPPHVPTYLSVAAGSSIFPARHFCSVCGYFSNYTCTQCGSRFCSVKCNATHKETRCLKFIA